VGVVATKAPSPHAIEPVANATSQDNVIMKAKLAIVVLGALVLIANGANAQHRTGNPTHVRYPSHASAPSYGLQYQSSGSIFESYSQGRQSYPNPDRELYVNRSCCS
jgi:hypothetical protein